MTRLVGSPAKPPLYCKRLAERPQTKTPTPESHTLNPSTLEQRVGALTTIRGLNELEYDLGVYMHKQTYKYQKGSLSNSVGKQPGSHTTRFYQQRMPIPSSGRSAHSFGAEGRT